MAAIPTDTAMAMEVEADTVEVMAAAVVVVTEEAVVTEEVVTRCPTSVPA